MTETRPYGSWSSPISADMLVSKSTRMADVWVSDDDSLYWLEMRPQEGGRFVVMKKALGDAEPVQLTPAPFNVRTRVHEYGGAPMTVVQGTLYFSHYGDHRLYRQAPGQAPEPVTAEGKMRYADPVYDAHRRRLIAVREDHSQDHAQATNTIVAIDPKGDSYGQVLVKGHDFYMYPRVSPDGARLSWIQWDHPNMPWDGTTLWVADLTEDGDVKNPIQVAGGPEESIFQPSWSPDGQLYFVSDRTNWWNLYRQTASGAIEPVTHMEVEFGEPNWGLGMSTYAFGDGAILATYTQGGFSHLVRIDLASLELTAVDAPYTVYAQIRANHRRAAFFAGSPKDPTALLEMDLSTHQLKVVKVSATRLLSDEDVSVPEAIVFPTHGLTAHAFFYPPKNHQFQAPEGEKPPLIVFTHGGPTGQTTAQLSLGLQYWTTRGFAVVDVNYGGSAGYGRAYRNRLYDSWGLVDVEDCTNAALYLVDQGRVDGTRLAIRGGSAGGYTTLACLTFRDVFSVGASYFGVSDIGALARETHKFESRYMDKLVGPWPEAKDIYDARSPLAHVDQITKPVIFFQGLDDHIVLPNQAELMVDALRTNGIPVAYLPFEGEGHGFVGAAHIIRAQEAELYFYAQIMGFALAESIEPVPIDNWTTPEPS